MPWKLAGTVVDWGLEFSGVHWEPGATGAGALGAGWC